jgi:hypothetical protein
MPEPQLARLFSEALDRLDYAMTDARLWWFDLMHGVQLPAPADEKREADRNGAGNSPWSISTRAAMRAKRSGGLVRARTARQIIRAGNND